MDVRRLCVWGRVLHIAANRFQISILLGERALMRFLVGVIMIVSMSSWEFSVPCLLEVDATCDSYGGRAMERM